MPWLQRYGSGKATTMTTRWTPRLTALALGGLLPLAFAPFGLWPVAILALAGLFWLWQGSAPREARWLGYAFGLGQFGVGVSWIFNSLHLFGDAIAPVAGLITFIFVAVAAAFPALAGDLAARLSAPGSRARLFLALPLAWLLLELMRGIFLGGFPWLNLGASMLATPLAGYGPVLGEYGMSLAVVLSAAALVALVQNNAVGLSRAEPRRGFGHGWPKGPRGGTNGVGSPSGDTLRAESRDGFRRRDALVVLPLLAVVWGASFGLARIDWVQPAGDPVSVAIVQGNVEQARKFDPERFEATLDAYRTLTEANSDARLILWPETAVPDLVSQAAPFLVEMQDQAREHGFQLVAGVFDEDRFGNYYNALLTLPIEGGNNAVGNGVGTPPGVTQGAEPMEGFGRYRKRHLVAFGEFLPLRFLIEPFKAFIQVPMSDLTSGAEEQPLLQLAGHAAGASICYEAALSREIRLALPQATFLINASNDAWFGDSLAPHQHLQIAGMRSLESGRWMARATNTGVSALIDPHGRVVARTPQFEQAVLRGEITPMQGTTPFVRWGEWPMWLLAGLGLAGLALRGLIRKRRG